MLDFYQRLHRSICKPLKILGGWSAREGVRHLQQGVSQLYFLVPDSGVRLHQRSRLLQVFPPRLLGAKRPAEHTEMLRVKL